MFNLTVVLVGLLGLLFIEEYLSRQQTFHGELARKFSHILLGLFAATWPWYLSWGQIEFLGAGAVVFTLANHFTKQFHYLGLVKRGGYGDIFFGLAILFCALISVNKIFFAVAMLELALADSLAALIGTKYEKNVSYKVLGQKKSIAGTLTFWLTSLLILAILLPSLNISSWHYLACLIIVPLVLSAIENIAVLGADNLAVTMSAIILLRIIH